MPNTSTATWPTLTAGQVARASDVEAKFDWSEYHLWPHAGGVTADNTYDLGNTSSAAWRSLYAYSINATSTARGLAIGTTTVANNSDVALEISGNRSLLIPRLTTTQKNNLAGIDGMMVYDSTISKFQIRQNGAWSAMGGITSIQEVTAKLTLNPTSTANWVSGTTTTVSINTVTAANAAVFLQGVDFSGTSAEKNLFYWVEGAVELENSTSIRARLSGQGGAGAGGNYTLTVYALVVEY